MGSIPLLGRSWRREWQPTPVFLSGESHGQRSLAGYGPWGRRVGHNWATEQQLTLKAVWSWAGKQARLVPLWLCLLPLTWSWHPSHLLLIGSFPTPPTRRQREATMWSQNYRLHLPQGSCPAALDQISPLSALLILGGKKKFSLRCCLLFSKGLALGHLTFLLAALALPQSLITCDLLLFQELLTAAPFLSLHLVSLKEMWAWGNLWPPSTQTGLKPSRRKVPAFLRISTVFLSNMGPAQRLSL